MNQVVRRIERKRNVERIVQVKYLGTNFDLHLSQGFGVVHRISGCDQRVFRMMVTLIQLFEFFSHIHQKRVML